MIKKTNAYLLLVIGLLLISTFLIYTTAGSTVYENPFENYKVELYAESKQMKAIHDNKEEIIKILNEIDPEEKVAIVNGAPIFLKGIIMEAVLHEVAGLELTIEEILSKRIMDELYYKEAIRLDLAVTEKEAQKFAEKMREAKDRVEDENDKSLFEIALAFRGVPEDEYWKQSVKVYQKALSIANLMHQIGQEAFNQLGDQLYAEADIDYLINVSELNY